MTKKAGQCNIRILLTLLRLFPCYTIHDRIKLRPGQPDVLNLLQLKISDAYRKDCKYHKGRKKNGQK